MKAVAGALMGPVGFIVGPLLAAGLKRAGENLPAGLQPLCEALSSVFANLAGDALANTVRELVPEQSNRPLRRAIVLSIKQGLAEAQNGIAQQGIFADRFDDWFGLWRRRLDRALKTPEDTATLFRSGQEPDAERWATLADEEWWPQFQPVLLRWAHEQQEWEQASTPGSPLDLSSIPEKLENYLRDRLRELTEAALRDRLESPGEGPAWIAWQQEFLRALARRGGQLNHQLEALASQLADEFAGVHRHLETTTEKILDEIRSTRRATRTPPQALVNLPDLSQPVLGRDAVALAILTYLEQQRVAVIVAPPMFGKTALIRRLLQEVTDGNAIKRPGPAGIVYLAGRLTLPLIFRESGRLTGEADQWAERAQPSGPVKDKILDYWNYLDSHGMVWLILDSFDETLDASGAVEDPEVAEWLNEFLRRASPHRMILASRVAPPLRGVQPLGEATRALWDGLELADCIQLWRQVLIDVPASEATEDLLEQLSARLHGMPAAIRAAAEYVNQLRTGGITPRRLLSDAQFFADFDRNDREKGFQSMIRRLVDTLDRPTRDLLELWSVLPEPVPEKAGEAVLPAGTLVRILARLAGSVMLAAVERDAFGELWYRLHPVARQVVRQTEVHLKPEWLDYWLDEGNSAYKTKRFLMAAALYECARQVAEQLVLAGRADLKENLATALMNRGVALDSLKQYSEALDCFARAIQIREELVQAGRADLKEDLATALINRGVALDSLKQYSEALDCYARAIQILEELVQAGRADLKENLAMALENKHVCVEAQGDLSQALELIRRAVEIRQELYEQGYTHQAGELRRAREWMAQTLDRLGRTVEAAQVRAASSQL